MPRWGERTREPSSAIPIRFTPGAPPPAPRAPALPQPTALAPTFLPGMDAWKEMDAGVKAHADAVKKAADEAEAAAGGEPEPVEVAGQLLDQLPTASLGERARHADALERNGDRIGQRDADLHDVRVAYRVRFQALVDRRHDVALRIESRRRLGGEGETLQRLQRQRLGDVLVDAAEVVLLELVATDVVHGIYIDGYGVNLEADPGQTKSITFTADETHDATFGTAAQALTRLAAAVARPLPADRGAVMAAMNGAFKDVKPATLAFITDGIATAVEGGKDGYIRPDGSWLLPPQYDRADPFALGRVVGRFCLLRGRGDRRGRLGCGLLAGGAVEDRLQIGGHFARRLIATLGVELHRAMDRSRDVGR